MTKHLRRVSFSGGILLSIFALIASLSESPSLASGHRFILPVVALLVLASLVAMAGLAQSLHVKPSEQSKLLFLIVCVAVSLRVVAVFTPPILEVDFYRYLWDGKVLASGVSPYAYSPAQVLAADSTNVDADYSRVVSSSIQSASNHTILSRVHFPDYTTIYPPVSQAVFAAAMKWFPAGASVTAHVWWLKFVLVAFDLATMFLIVRLLLLCRRSLGWLIGYAWNPLVIKEIANSAHLDSIAVFFTIAAVYFAAVFIAEQTTAGRRKSRFFQIATVDGLRSRNEALTRSSATPILWPVLSGLCLGLGFGAKLFPIVLAPLFALTLAKSRWSAAFGFSLALAVTVAGCLWVHHQAMGDRSVAQQHFAESPTGKGSREGLGSFLSQWRMNDVVFSGIYRNLKPDSELARPPWFVISSNDRRENVIDWCRERSLGGGNPAFFLARLVTMTAFLVFYVWRLVKTFRSPMPIEIDQFAWVLAVFLFLQPTVNPWYWVWVAPLSCFSNSKGWLFVSGLLSVYYLRFWFDGFAGIGGSAADSAVLLFDHGVAWLEFAAILGVAIYCVMVSRRKSRLAVA